MILTQRSSLPTRKGKFIWFVLAILIFAAVGGYIYYSKVYAKPQTTTASQTKTATIQRGNLVVSASGTGTLIAQTDASFGFDTSGQVTKVDVKVGDQVQDGQVLAQLDDTLAQMKYNEAQQALQELRSAASIAKVQQEIATAQDTEYYAHEWLKYLLSPEVIEAEENLAIAEQKLAAAQTQAASNPSGTSDQTVMQKERAVEYLQDKLTQAQEYYQKYYLPETFGVYENVGSRRHPKQVLVTYIDPKTGKVIEEINAPSADDIAIARNNYVQAQQTIKEGKIYLEALNTGVIPEGATGEKLTALYNAQVAVEDAKLALDATQLVAPISGTVTSLDLSVGEQAGTSSVVTISQLSQPYTLDVYINAEDWGKAQIGNKVNVTFDLLPEQTYPGTVALVYPELSSSFEASLVHLIVQLDHSLSQDLPAGTGATVEVVGGEVRGVLMVPIKAIHQAEGSKYTVTVLQNGQKTKREVEVGLKNDTYAEVKSGLEAGEIVVTK